MLRETEPAQNDGTDFELWHDWKSGEESAFRELLSRYSGLVWSVCQRILHRKQDAEDAFQVTFLTLFRRGDQITQSGFGPWIRKVAYHASLEIQRQRIKSNSHEELAMENIPDTKQAFEQIEILEQNLTIEEAINSLPDHLYHPLVQFHFEGRSRHEIAKESNLSESTVKSRLQQARGKLKDQLVRRGLGASAMLVLLNLPNLAHAEPSQHLIEETISKLEMASSESGLISILDCTTTLERKLFMSGNGLSLAKGAGIAIVTAVIVSMLSIVFNTHNNGQIVAAQQSKLSTDTPVTQQSPASNAISFDLTKNKLDTSPSFSTTNIAPIQDSTRQPVSAFKPAIETTEGEADFSGLWTSAAGNKLEIDAESNLISVEFKELEEGLVLKFTCEYRMIGDTMVGVIMGAEVVGMASEEAKIISLQAGMLSGQPVAAKVRRIKDMISVSSLKLGPAQAIDTENGFQQFTMLIEGLYKSSPK